MINVSLQVSNTSCTMSSFLITGANRGLGLGLVRKLLDQQNPPALIIATYRNANASTELLALAEKNPRLKTLQLEVSNVSSFKKFANEVAALVGSSGLNVLINMAGIHPGKFTLESLTTEDDHLNVYKTNVIGPVFLIKALLPLIKKAADINKNKPMGIHRAAILNISSGLGSVGANTEGKHYAYRESKAALNIFTRSLVVELENTGILILPFCPGWVQTDLGGADAPLTVEQSVSSLCKVFYDLKESQNGQFLQYDGQIVPW